jgi:hypothetical protein
MDKSGTTTGPAEKAVATGGAVAKAKKENEEAHKKEKDDSEKQAKNDKEKDEETTAKLAAEEKEKEEAKKKAKEQAEVTAKAETPKKGEAAKKTEKEGEATAKAEAKAEEEAEKKAKEAEATALLKAEAKAKKEEVEKKAKEAEATAKAEATKKEEAAKKAKEEAEATEAKVKEEAEKKEAEKKKAAKATTKGADVKQKTEAEGEEGKQKTRKSRRRRLSEAPATVLDPTGINVTIPRNTEESTVLVTYGLPTFPFSSESTSTEQSARLYPAVFHTEPGLLSQRDYVAFRPQFNTPAQTCIFFGVLQAPLDDTGTLSHTPVKALLCDMTGAALKVSPTLPRLVKAEKDPVGIDSALWARCVSQQKKLLETLRPKQLTANRKWEDTQKRAEAKKKDRKARREEQLAKTQADEEYTRVCAENERLKRQHATDTKELQAAKRAKTEVCQPVLRLSSVAPCQRPAPHVPPRSLFLPSVPSLVQ